MSELAKIMIDGISLETLLEVYYKDLKRREKNRQAIKKYRATEKGKANQRAECLSTKEIARQKKQILTVN